MRKPATLERAALTVGSVWPSTEFGVAVGHPELCEPQLIPITPGNPNKNQVKKSGKSQRKTDPDENLNATLGF